MSGGPVIVSIVGWSGTGKTTFIEKAIEECARRAIPVAAFKKSRHPADLAPDGKDSTRFHAAGADPSVYLSGTEMLLLGSPPPSMDASTLKTLSPRATIIFCEGLEVPGAIRVLVSGEETEEKALKRPLGDVDVLVARSAALRAAAAGRGLAAFDPGSAAAFIDHIVS